MTIGWPRRTAGPSEGLRAANGLGSLSRNSAMDSVALNRANRLAAANGPLGHNPNHFGQIPGGWGSAAGYVARGYPDRFLRHDEWMDSSGHRSNIVGDFIDVGAPPGECDSAFGTSSAASFLTSAITLAILVLIAVILAVAVLTVERPRRLPRRPGLPPDPRRDRPAPQQGGGVREVR